jgi:hypothetical protein
MREWLQLAGGFFPIKLLLLHFRRSLLMMAFWLLLFGMAGGLIFKDMGFLYLFVTPEYLENVSWISYLIMGVTLGLFTMAFHISTYIFYSYRFPFLAALSRPIYRYSINNSIIPIAFYGFYITQIVGSQMAEQVDFWEIFGQITALLLGSILTISLVFTYFFSTLKTVKLPLKKEVRENLEKPLDLIIKKEKKLREGQLVDAGQVDSYLKNFFTIKQTRSVSHYDDGVLLSILQKHHKSAAWFFILILAILILLSTLSDREVFQIPAGSSIVLLLTLYVMVAGAFYSWFKTWSVTVGILVVLALNFMVATSWLDRPKQAFGLDYEAPKAYYNYATLNQLTTDSIQAWDRNEMLKILENWKQRQPPGTKPKMVIINSSGGGLRSSVWTFGVMQALDSITEGHFSKQTFAIFGSSGGMIGAAYFRALKLLEAKGDQQNPWSPTHMELIGKDLLNPVALKLTLNDLLFMNRRFQDGAHTYRADRGLAFEKQLHKNLNAALKKRISDYKEPEKQAMIPLLILTPTIVQDGRRLIISPQGLSFLTRNQNPYTKGISYEIDGVEMRRFLQNQQGDSLWMATALRMSATFPYITPLVSLPTIPNLQIIDAGARDNEGFSLTANFLHTFREWLADNTSGVTIVRIKANRADEILVASTGSPSLLENLQNPIFGVVNSYSNFQYFSKFSQLEKAPAWIDYPLDFQTYSLLTLDNEVSLSWHLTMSERKKIAQELRSTRIIEQMQLWKPGVRHSLQPQPDEEVR